nr:uncharacterized protein LOC114823138 [Malus domestica]
MSISLILMRERFTHNERRFCLCFSVVPFTVLKISPSISSFSPLLNITLSLNNALLLDVALAAQVDPPPARHPHEPRDTPNHPHEYLLQLIKGNCTLTGSNQSCVNALKTEWTSCQSFRFPNSERLIKRNWICARDSGCIQDPGRIMGRQE